ncbi:hypothetical protein ACNKHV_12940 [Shigella flexneri]
MWAFTHDLKTGGVSTTGGNLQQLVEDSKAARFITSHIAMANVGWRASEKTGRSIGGHHLFVLLIPDVFTFNILDSRLEEMNGVPVVPLYEHAAFRVNRLPNVRKTLCWRR